MNIGRGLVLALSLAISACGGSSGSTHTRSLSANQAPSISLNGDVSVQITVGSSYSDPGASAVDAEDGDLSGSIGVDSTLDSDRAGNYRITYTVTDSAGASVSVTRAVEVVADPGSQNAEPPIVTDPGDPEVRELELKAWVGESNTRVKAIDGADGLEFYRTTDADCDLVNYATCANGQMDILNGFGFTDTAFLLGQPAYYTLKDEDEQASFPVSAQHFQPRFDHEVVAFNGKLWVIGGRNSSGRNSEVWSSEDGHTWMLETRYGSFGVRQNHQVVEFKGKLWILGGASGTGFASTIYSSKDGVDWNYEGINGVVARVGHEVVVYQDKLWLIGGHTRWVWRGQPDLNYFENDVWTSEDGVTWEQVEVSQPFIARSQFGLAVFKDKLWIVGGLTGEGDAADVWSSSDGANWVQSPATGFPGRMEHQLTVFGDKLWMTGGRSHLSDTSISAPLYSSVDGETWIQVGASAAARRYAHSAVVWNDELWLTGGYGAVDGKDGVSERLGDVWHSRTGGDWVRTDAGIRVTEPVHDHQMVAFNNKLWIIGEGSDMGDSASGIWSSEDGLVWAAVESDTDFSELHGHQVVAFNDKLWVIAGEDSEYRNTVWSSSDGVAWTVETADPGFPVRKDHQVAVFQGALWLTGGHHDSDSYSDIWTSMDGVTWVNVTPDPALEGRVLHQMVVFNDKLWVIGGGTVDRDVSNDVWYSMNGIDWTQEEGFKPFRARRGHQLAVFNDTLWLAGGYDEHGNYLNDVWSTTNGTDWTEVTEAAPFSGRQRHQLVAFGDHLILSGGKTADQRGLTDVWRTPNGLDWQRAYLRTVNAN